MLRYNAPDFQIPNPRISLTGGTGIQVIGNYPNYTIASNIALTVQNIQTTRLCNLYSQDNVEEIVYTYNFVYTMSMIVTVTVDFSMRLGPGFASTSGAEMIQYVLGFRTLNTSEPPYGRRIKGTGVAGFSNLVGALTAYANASVTQTFELDMVNNLQSNLSHLWQKCKL